LRKCDESPASAASAQEPDPAPSAGLGRRIAAGVLTFALLTVVVSLLGLLREKVTAHHYGTSDELDAFLIAFAYLRFALFSVGSSAEISFLPAYIETKETAGSRAAAELLATTSLLLSVLLALVGAGLVVAAPRLLPIMATGFAPGKLALTQQAARWLVPYVVLMGLFGLWRGVLSSRERLAAVSIAPGLQPLAVVLVVLWKGRSGAASALLWGYTLGVVAQLALVGWAMHRAGVLVLPGWHGANRALRRMAQQFGHQLGASVLSAIVPLINGSVAAALLPGSVAVLNYGQKLVMMLVMFNDAITLAVFPRLSEMVTRADHAALRRTVVRGTLILLGVVVPVALLLVALSRPIVQVLFVGGRFGPEAAMAVVAVQRLLLLQLPATCLISLYGRLLNAAKWNQFMTWAAAVCVPLTYWVATTLARQSGVTGIALAGTLMTWLSAGMLGWGSWIWMRRAAAAPRVAD